MSIDISNWKQFIHEDDYDKLVLFLERTSKGLKMNKFVVLCNQCDESDDLGGSTGKTTFLNEICKKYFTDYGIVQESDIIIFKKDIDSNNLDDLLKIKMTFSIYNIIKNQPKLILSSQLDFTNNEFCKTIKHLLSSDIMYARSYSCDSNISDDSICGNSISGNIRGNIIIDADSTKDMPESIKMRSIIVRFIHKFK